ncbi:hypothetical protein [Streptomyces sp. NPDC001880]
MALTACGSDDSPTGSGAAVIVSAEQGTSSKSDKSTDASGSTTVGSGASGSTGTATETVARKQATAKARRPAP